MSNNNDFDFLDELEDLTDHSCDKQQAKEKPSFQTEKLEERVLFSATWIDADTGEENSNGTDADDVFTGSDGRDVANAGSGNDILDGLEGDDVLRGQDGDDVISGGEGNDNISGGSGADELYGGDGNDLIYADSQDTVVDGGDGTDRVIVQGGGDFSIDQASSSIERVDGGSGNDSLNATDATERVTQLGNAGNDTLIGGSGNDAQYGGVGNDTIDGGQGNDVIRGDSGNDQLIGGDGNDNIAGGTGADELYGGDGNDLIYADAEDTKIDGGSGNDRVIVQGDDDFEIDQAATNVERVDGGSGNDTVDGSNATERVTQLGNAGNDTLIGGSGNDVQQGGDGSDNILGGDGDDRLRGDSGDDVLSGGSGNDNIVGGSGSDEIFGGDGNDLIYADADDTIVDGGEGNDRVIVQGGEDFSIDQAESSIERVDGGSGNDSLDATSATERVTQLGNAGNDTLLGGSGDDHQYGGDGDDVVSGGAGNDRIQGGSGADELRGGSGNDLIYADAQDTVIDGGEGSDRVIVQGGEDFSIDQATSSVERVDGGSGNDTLDATSTTSGVVQLGNAGNDNLLGGSGNDNQQGGAGDDVLSGGAGNDRLSGGDGADELRGGEGDDLIYAEANDSVIDGGQGNDRVIVQGSGDFSIDQGAASIERVDASSGNDTLDASGMTERAVQLGNAGNDALIGGAAGDHLDGGSGNDTITGGAGNDRIIGGEGADDISGGEGNDTISADENDVVRFSGEFSDYEIRDVGNGRIIVTDLRDGSPDGSDNIYNAATLAFSDGTATIGEQIEFNAGEVASLEPAAEAVPNQIEGTSGNDVLRGSNGTDIIDGGAGNDNIAGGDGADELRGGQGNDLIYASAVDTVVDGGEGQDRVIVQGGGDFSIDQAVSSVERVDGGSGNDALDASLANERVTQLGNAGDDTLLGGAGDDHQYGGDGADKISGGDGNDRIQGGSGADELIGGDGNDLIYADSQDTVVDGGDGTDRVIVQGGGDFSIDQAASSVERVDAGSGNDTLNANNATDRVTQLGNAGDDTLIGGSGDDAQHGGDGDDFIDGNDGNDVIRGDYGNDRISGGDGNDNIAGGSGADQLIGGEGNDLIYADAQDTLIDGGAGIDRVIVQGGEDFNIDQASSNVERVDGGSGNDSLNAANATDSVTQLGNAGNDILVGGTGNDTQYGGDNNDDISGGEGNDRIRGDFGDDRLFGGDGNDNIVGGEGADELYGGDGNDLIYADVNDTVIDGGAGNDRVIVQGEGNFTIDQAASNIERVDAGSGDDTVDASNATSNVTQLGNAGNDTLIGGSGNDRLYGGDGADQLVGGSGNDRMYGGFGDDSFHAGAGNDYIDGQEGDDTVVFDGDFTDYQITQQNNGQIIVEDQREGSPDGRDVVTRVENLRFNDGTATIGAEIDFTHQSMIFSGGSIEENADAGTVVGEFEIGDNSFTYEFVDSDGNPDSNLNFEIDGNKIIVAENADINFEESERFEFYVRSTAENGEQYIESIEINITDVNEGQTSAGESFTIAEDGSVNGNLLANDSDLDGDHLTVASFEQPENGQVLVDSNGDFVYEPDENFSGTDTFTYTITDGKGATSTESVEITVEAVADGVELSTFDASGNEDEAIDLEIDISMIDADGSENISSITIGNVPEGASLSAGIDNGDGTWSLAPGDIDGLQITPAENSHDDFELVVEVTTTDGQQKIDFSNGVDSHGGYVQDKDGEFEIREGGDELFIAENGWKSVPGNFVVTENTIVELEYRSTELPEFVSIGFDNDSTWNNGPRNSDFFKIFGEQQHGDAADNAFEVYQGDGEYQTIRIPVGEFMSGEFDRMTFINDDDAANAAGNEGNSYFRNVRIFEEGSVSTKTVNQTIQIEVNSVNDDVTDLEIDNTTVLENSVAGTVVGTLSAHDADTDESFSFEFVDTEGNVVDNSNFEIVENRVVVKAGANLDFESSDSHELSIRVTDSGGSQHTEVIEVSLENVNEGQIAQGETFEIDEDGSVTGNLLANDVDIDGDELTIESYQQPAHGSVTVDEDGSFTYQPIENFSGSDSFSYTVTDNNGATSTQTVEIDIAAIADQADLRVSDAVGNEDNAIELDVAASVLDNDGSETIASITINDVPNGASLSAGVNNGDGSWSLQPENLDGLRITPAEDSHEDFELKIEVTTVDGDSQQTTERSLMVQIDAVNDEVTDLKISNLVIAENSVAGTVVGTLTASDVDVGETFTFEIVDANGNVVDNPNFEIIENEVRVKNGAELNFEAENSHQLMIRVTDSGGSEKTESFEILVEDINEGPTALADHFSTNEDEQLIGNLLANDFDVDSDELAVSGFDQPENGSVEVQSNGEFVYLPDQNFSGTDSFTYQVSDGAGGVSTQTVEISVSAVADEAQIQFENAVGDEDTAIDLNIDLDLSDTDGSEIISNVTIRNVPQGAILSAGMDLGDGSWALQAGDLEGLQITPAENNNDNFELEIAVDTTDDQSQRTTVQTIQVEVAAINDEITELTISNASVPENAAAGTIVGTLTATDVDDGEIFTYEIVDNSGEVVENANFEIVDGELRVKNGANLNFESERSHEITVRATDSGGSAKIESFEISVQDVNEGPAALADNYVTLEDQVVEGNLLSNDFDVDGDQLTVTQFEQPTHGTVVVQPDGSFVYEPNENFSGTDSFTYQISDGNGGVSTQNVEFVVEAVADAADIDARNASGDEDAPIELKIGTSLIDVDGSESIARFRIIGVPDGAELSAGVNNGDGSWTIPPDELEGLQIELRGFANEDFELEIEATTADGNSSNVQSEFITVEVQNNTLQSTLALEQNSESNALTNDPSSIGSDSNSVNLASTVEDNDFDFDSAYNEISQIAQQVSEFSGTDIWNQPEFDSLHSEFEEIQDTAHESDVTPESESTSFEIESFELPDRNIVEPVEFEEFEVDELSEIQVEIDGVDTDEVGTANMTAASLLLLFTKREDSRKKLLKVENSKKEQDDNN